MKEKLKSPIIRVRSNKKRQKKAAKKKEGNEENPLFFCKRISKNRFL